jgi:hypothetical protein
MKVVIKRFFVRHKDNIKYAVKKGLSRYTFIYMCMCLTVSIYLFRHCGNVARSIKISLPIVI